MVSFPRCLEPFARLATTINHDDDDDDDDDDESRRRARKGSHKKKTACVSSQRKRVFPQVFRASPGLWRHARLSRLFPGFQVSRVFSSCFSFFFEFSFGYWFGISSSSPSSRLWLTASSPGRDHRETPSPRPLLVPRRKGFHSWFPKTSPKNKKPPRRRHFRRRFILGWFLFLIVSSVWWFCVSFASSDVIMIVLALSHASPFVCPWAPLGFSQSNLFVILLQIFFPFFFFGSKSQAVSTPSRGHLCSRQNTSYVHSVFHLLIIHTAVCCHHSRSILHSGCSLHVHFQLFSSSSLMISKITVAFHICLHRSLVVR